MNKVYIQTVVTLPAQDPDFRQFIPPMQARRMGRLLKRSLVSAKQALAEAGVEMPDAVICGTAHGCMETSIRVMQSLREQGEGSISPTDFMQSTHNTIASTVAIQLGCHGYNCTYSQGPDSLANALLDAWLLISAGDIETALVLAADENTEAFPLTDRAQAIVLSSHTDGTLRELSQEGLQPFIDELNQINNTLCSS